MENILVAIRVRPLTNQESVKGNPWKLATNSIALSSALPTSGQAYNFDKVFGADSKTAEIYDAHAKKIISSAVQGFNGTIFAYGQTSSGKTFTMRGSEDEPGIIPLAIQDVFHDIEEVHNREFLLRVSYMEIYNEEIKDLFAPDNCKLQVHENFEIYALSTEDVLTYVVAEVAKKKMGCIIGLREEIVTSPEQVLQLMDNGEAYRHVGETNMNAHSSRSHAIFRMVIESRDKSQDDSCDLPNSDPVRVSHLNLVDLAGSERISKTGAEGTRLKEGTHINKSLMTLGNVINKLSEGIEKQGGHIPYRDSKLTRILQPALGGNARTVIICNITPALVHIDETRGTLHFASRAKRVTNCAQVNEIVTDAALLKRQKNEIAELRQKLQNMESPSDQHEEEILNLRNELLKTELERERDRERMALELQEVRKVQAERERRIKEQEQKIRNLNTMVINSAHDGRDYEKRSKRGNRRETWCARPESGLPLAQLDLERPPQKDGSGSADLPFQINKKWAFGLQPPFEALMEAEEGSKSLIRWTSSSLEEGLEEEFSMDDGLSLPDPGSESFVADRKRKSSNEWITANETEQQLLDLQGHYDTLQWDFMIQMCDKDAEIDRLRKDLVYTRSILSISGKDSTYKKFLDAEKRGKSLDGWVDTESAGTIKRLRAQVENLDTEKEYMERELQRVLQQAKEQSYAAKQELEEVYQELSSAKEDSAELSIQLGKSQQQVQQLQMQKLEEDVAYLQLASALKDLKNEVDSITVPSSALQSSINESLQLVATNVKVFQEWVVDARDLSLLANNIYERNKATLNSKREAEPDHLYCTTKSVELDEKVELMDVGHSNSSPDKVRMRAEVGCAVSPKEDGVQPCPSSLDVKLHHFDDADGTTEYLESRNTEVLKSEELKVSEIKHCYYDAGEERPRISENNVGGCLGEESVRKKGLLGHWEMARQFRESEGPRHQKLAARQTPVSANWQVLEGESSKLKEAELSLVEKPPFLLKHSDVEDKVEDSKLTLQSVEDDNMKWCSVCNATVREFDRREICVGKLVVKLAGARNSNPQTAMSDHCDGEPNNAVVPGANDKLYILEEEVNWAIGELKTLYKTIEMLQAEVNLDASEENGFQRQEPAFAEEIVHLKSSLQFVVDEKDALTKASEEMHSALERHRAEKDTLLSREASLSEEVVSLKSILKAVKDDQKSWIRASEQTLQELAWHKVELDSTLKKLELTRDETDNAQIQILDLNALLSQKLEEQESLKKKLKDVEEEKSTLTGNVAEFECQLKSLRTGAAEALQEMEVWQQRYQTETAQCRADITSLRKELSSSKAVRCGLFKERDNLQRDLEKSKSKIKDVEARLKTTVQDKSKLESQKLSMERELRQLRQSNFIQCDINKRDSIVDQRCQSLASGVHKKKMQWNSVEHALQIRNHEVENLTYDLRQSQESYVNLEFAMAEAESYSKERLNEVEGALSILNDEKDVVRATAERLQIELKEANEQCRTTSHQLKTLKDDLVALSNKLQICEDERMAAQASAAAIGKEKEDIVEELLDAHFKFEKQKSLLTTQVQENKEKCNAYELDIVHLTDELQKVKKLHQECLDVSRLLQDRLQQALEADSEKSLRHHKLLKQLESDVECHKERCRELVKEVAAEKRQQDLRLSGLVQLEELKDELQQCTTKFSKAEAAEQMLSLENQSFLIANTKLQFALDASRDRAEVFEGRFDDLDWEFTELKRLLQKSGLIQGDAWDLQSLKQILKQIKTQNLEARRLETHLASKKMQIVELQVESAM